MKYIASLKSRRCFADTTVFRVVIEHRTHRLLIPRIINLEHIAPETGNNSILSTDLNTIIPMLHGLHSGTGKLCIQVIDHLLTTVISRRYSNVHIPVIPCIILNFKCKPVILSIDP